MNGVITEIIGPVVDVYFKESRPAIGESLVIEASDGHGHLILEVASHLGLDRVRAISMNETSGLTRGESARATGAPISVPVGEATLGRLFNVLGETVDGKGAMAEDVVRLPIHRAPPTFDEQTTKAEIFETGIKAIDLIIPFLKGGEGRPLRRRRRREDGAYPGTHPQRCNRARRLLRLRGRWRARARGQRPLS